MKQFRRIFVSLSIVAVTAIALLPLIATRADAPAAAPAAADSAPRRVKVLFLGDNGHHKPLERFRQAVTEMTVRGIDMTYVDDLSQITPQNLKRFDVLALYANTEKVTPEAEKAILDYVANGGGYAVLHCGSYCFLNSAPLTALTGGRFQKHGAGVFKETHVQPDHELLKDLKPIESWDETYVHNMHNETNRTVLSVREDKDGKEPYTWTRTEGKGRVFYTAWGHDERTWGNKDFLDLIERGMRWSAGDWALQPQPKLKPFEYGEGKAPNYIVSKQWGQTGPLITKIQKPLPPEESIKHMITPAGIEPKLFASEPKIFKPIAMNWDERGRLWIAETFDYPNELQEPGKGRDRISIVEDTNNDGVADKFTVFAEKLSIPTSLLPYNGGIIVSQAPDMLFLKDTDGDNKADVRQVLFTGWGTNDTHAGPSNLRWGPDNWIYGIVGYSGFNGTVGGGERQRFGNGIWRMKPDGTKLEFLATLTNNAWGLGFSEEGHLFASTANGDPSFYMHIPNRAYETVRGLTVKRLTSIADSPKMYVATTQVRQVDHHGNYTAGAGHALYTARTWPSYYWNRTAFVTEGTGHIVGQFLLQPRGAGFVARNDGSTLASTDEWTSPIVAEVGPDGQLWVIDWYNFVVQHNPIPQGFDRGKGGAYETPLRDKSHGRIYRLVHKDGTPSRTFDLSKATSDDLINALRSDNQFWRMHAQRLIVERKDKSIAEHLYKLAGDRTVDAIGLNPAAIHALWTMQGLELLDGSNGDAMAAVEAALGHPSAGVRKAAVDVLPRGEAGLAALLKAKSLEDADPQVRKSALLAFAEMPSGNAAAAQAVYNAVAGPAVGDDRWLIDAATIAAAKHDAQFLQSAVAAFKLPEATGEPEKPQTSTNLIRNASFEEVAGGRPRNWRPRNYSGESTQEMSTTVARTGKNSVMLRSERGSDTSWYIDVPVEPRTTYRLSAWIKTENLKTARGGLGALLNVHGTTFKTKAITGTNDWTQVEVTFQTEANATVSINCLYGGWGHATGTAWYDDIELTKAAGAVKLPGSTGQVLSAVISHYAQRAPKESVVATLASLKSAEPQIATVVIDALSASWPEGAGSAPELTEADAKQLQAVMAALPPGGRDRLLALAAKWNRVDIFGDALASAVKDLHVTLDDPAADADKRAGAARRLIAIADTPEHVAAILKHVNPQSLPAVQTALLQAIGDSRSPAVGDELVSRWVALTPTAQKIVLPTLLRREAWTRSLLAGVKAGTVNPKDVLPQQWQALTSHPDADIAKLANQLQKSTGQNVSADRKAIVDKLIPLASKTGDATKGKLVYEKNCMVCHAMEGKGGVVGPDLTGIGARPKTDVMIDVLDPNRSVEGNFRQWSAKTEDDVLTGRLLSESQTSIEIIDAAGTVHAIQRSQLKSLSASEKSVMPEGFEALPPEELTDLLEYMGTSKVKH